MCVRLLEQGKCAAGEKMLKTQFHSPAVLGDKRTFAGRLDDQQIVEQQDPACHQQRLEDCIADRRNGADLGIARPDVLLGTRYVADIV